MIRGRGKTLARITNLLLDGGHRVTVLVKWSASKSYFLALIDIAALSESWFMQFRMSDNSAESLL